MQKSRLSWLMAVFLGISLSACGGGGGSDSSSGVTPPPSNGGGVVVPPGDNNPGPNPGNPGDDGDHGGDDGHDGGDHGGDDGHDGGDNGGDDGGNDDGDAPIAEKPVVLETRPAENMRNVDPDANISIVFSAPIDASSVTASSVYLTGPSGTISVSLSVSKDTVIIDPRNRLNSGASYTATVRGDVRSIDGVSLGSNYNFKFSVADDLAGVCAGFYDDGFALIQGKNATPPKTGLSKPAYGVAYSDPVYKTCVARASDAKSLGVGWVRNDYSRRQAFNADSTRYLALARYGRWIMHDAKTTSIIRELKIKGGGIEPQWHSTDPDLIYIIDDEGGYTIRTYNVKTDEIKIIADFRKVSAINGHPGKTSITQVWPNAARAWTRWEGSPSKDGRYWAFMVQTSSGQGIGMMSYDLQTNTITGLYEYATDGNGVGEPDHISMSATGDFVVPSWDSPRCPSMSQLGTRNRPCGLMSFSRDFSKAVGLAMASPHSDIGLDANGRDIIVGGDYDDGLFKVWDLATGKPTTLFNMYENSNATAMHISAKNFNRPGWALVSTYAERKQSWYTTKVFAIELKANPRILNIAHTYNKYSTYWTEPHAVVNRDFTQILFNSNWGSGNEDGDVYLITLPHDAIPE